MTLRVHCSSCKINSLAIAIPTLSSSREFFFSSAREHMEKGSLRDVLQDSEFDLKAEVLLSILQDISQGMRFLHASDPPVLHGDLKVSLSFASLFGYMSMSDI